MGAAATPTSKTKSTIISSGSSTQRDEKLIRTSATRSSSRRVTTMTRQEYGRQGRRRGRQGTESGGQGRRCRRHRDIKTSGGGQGHRQDSKGTTARPGNGAGPPHDKGQGPPSQTRTQQDRRGLARQGRVHGSECKTWPRHGKQDGGASSSGEPSPPPRKAEEHINRQSADGATKEE